MTDLERLAAIDAIRDLQARYVRYADEKRWQDLADLFLPDATFVSHDVNGTPVATMTGRTEIARVTDASVGSAQPIHHLFSYEIDLESPTTARGVWSMEDLVVRPDHEPLPPATEGGPRPFRSLHGYGHYRARYERVADTWLIAELVQTRLKLDFTY
jgi:hypothetical protein